MISPVSFGSTYKIVTSSKDSIKQQLGHDKIARFCEDIQIPYSETTTTSVSKPFGETRYQINTTMVANDREDKSIEAFFAANGINFRKYAIQSLMNPKVIESRVQPAPSGFKLAKINADKLEKFLLNQKDNNFNHCKSDYKKYYCDELDFMLKSGDDIPAATLYITPWGNKNSAIDYINRWGSENLNEDTMGINLAQRTDSPDHCMYFAMKNAGMNSIPVYMDNDSYELAQAMGLCE